MYSGQASWLTNFPGFGIDRTLTRPGSLRDAAMLRLNSFVSLYPTSLSSRHTSHDASSHPTPLIHIPRSSIYHFGGPSPGSGVSKPVFRDVEWRVYEHEAWAIVGGDTSGKEMVFKTLLGQLKIHPPPPPPGGLFPLLSLGNTPAASSHDPFTALSHVSFRHRSGSSNGGFYDFTARYGAMRDDDQKITLFESMFPEYLEMNREKEGVFEWQREARTRTAERLSEEEFEQQLTEDEKSLFEELIEKTGLRRLLDVPLVTLSNGQMRRARIVKAVLKKPELLLLDEPLTGLDVKTRPKLVELLRDLHVARKPRIMVGLRTQDEIPDWITHVAFVKRDQIDVGKKEEVMRSVRAHVVIQQKLLEGAQSGVKSNVITEKRPGRVVVSMKNANIQYENRQVLKNITWTIRLGERWHLQGTNGSGKSTLLSLVTGAHPLSFSLPDLELYGQKRSRIPTPLLQSRIGEMSPEMFDAFPRRMPGMNVWAAVGTGFEGAFVERGKEGVGVGVEMGGLGNWDDVRAWRIRRTWEILEAIGPASWGDTVTVNQPAIKIQETLRGGLPYPLADLGISPSTMDFAQRRFVELSAGEQRVVLVMRSLVARPPLVLLDEALSGMSEGMVRAVRRYISSGGVGCDQALVAVSHWDDELPFSGGGKVFRLD
ncbi:hypothetical protein AMATHDRAFT_81756 [Amanita thiersii Skay4041]|uniref:ABC transporter domain-containing protein n=1 Tax=Amanita thiersii Skay4041 TaxID=703135 RepID=A0A2A9NLI9_9AGAR|nr:hypothetical protein AMATHDRAFT_81756 [Amanita thiersii Skay4041]